MSEDAVDSACSLTERATFADLARMLRVRTRVVRWALMRARRNHPELGLARAADGRWAFFVDAALRVIAAGSPGRGHRRTRAPRCALARAMGQGLVNG